MRQREVLLADHGFIPDPGRIELTDSTVVFYHYTRDERAERVLEARRRPLGAPPRRPRRLSASKDTTSSRGCWSRCRFG